MSDWKFIPVIIGIFGALAGVYFRESLRRAHHKKEVAVRLEAYINDLLRHMLEGEWGFLFIAGETWQKERLEAYARGGVKASLAVDEKYKAKLEEAKEKFKKGDEETDKKISKDYLTHREMPQEIFNYFIKQLELTRDYLMSDKVFISDQDAACISWYVADKVIQIRGYFIEIIHRKITLAMILRGMEQLELEPIREQVFSLVEIMIRLSTMMTPIRIEAELIRLKSLITLTLDIMFGKSY